MGQLLAHVRTLCDRLEAQAEVSYMQADGTKARLAGLPLCCIVCCLAGALRRSLCGWGTTPRERLGRQAAGAGKLGRTGRWHGWPAQQ